MSKNPNPKRNTKTVAENNDRIENELTTPFDTNKTSSKADFDERKIRRRLKEILAEKDHKLINHIIDDKKIFPNCMAYEKGVFRDKEGKLLEIFHGGKEGFDVPLHIMVAGDRNGLSIVSHNHMNGLVIPSLKDIKTVNLLKSKYNPIYSPNKTGLLINTNVSKNQKNWKEISNKYEKFFNDKKDKIEKFYPEDAKRIRDKYGGRELEEKLDELYRSYFVKNQEKIVKEINTLFKENNFDIKIYIL